MEPFLLLDWDGVGLTISLPPTVGLAQSIDELDRTTEDAADFLTEQEVYERGWRWCQCYSACAPDGAGGHVQAERLLTLLPEEFEAALAALRQGPAFFENFVELLPMLIALRGFFAS